MEKRKITLAEYKAYQNFEKFIDERHMDFQDPSFSVKYIYEDVVVATPFGDEFSNVVLKSITITTN